MRYTLQKTICGEKKLAIDRAVAVHHFRFLENRVECPNG